jgi:hypothetical protein
MNGIIPGRMAGLAEDSPMRRRFMPGRRDERGQVLIIVAGGLVIMILAIGLVIDTGIGFMTRRGSQNAADLGSLAGTKVIADHYTQNTSLDGPDVHAAIDASLAANGCESDEGCSWTAEYVDNLETPLGTVTEGDPMPVGTQGVAVSIARAPQTFFMRVIGLDTIAVATSATSITAAIDRLPPGQVLPIAADPPNNNFQSGEVYELTAGKDAPGNFSWLSWDGSNDPNTLATSICTPNNPEMTFPVWITGDPGKSNSDSVRDCVDYWIDNGGTVLIPLWDDVAGNGNNTDYRIVGLAAFVLTARGQPAIDSIQGRFVGYYGLPSIGANYGGPPDPTGANAAYFLGLIR